MTVQSGLSGILCIWCGFTLFYDRTFYVLFLQVNGYKAGPENLQLCFECSGK